MMNSSGDSEPTLSQRKKIVVVGDGFCGKTSMLFAFSSDEFLENYIPTVCETFIKEVQVDGRRLELVMWDTAGQETYDRLRPAAYTGCHAVIICFSVDDPNSYENVRLKWCPEVRHFCPGIPVVLVATKLDLRLEPDPDSRDPERPSATVTSAEGTRMGQRVGSSAYVECSAKTRVGIQRVFEVTAREVLQSEVQAKKRQSHCSVL